MPLRSRTAVFLLALCLAALLPPARAQEARDPALDRSEGPAYHAWAKGRAAERAGNLEAALDAYSEASRLEPANQEFAGRAQSVRYALAQSFTNRAERALLSDNILEAAALLRRALSYDPRNSVAGDRLRQLQRHAIEETSSLPEYSPASPLLAPKAGTRDFRYRGDARGAYQELARQFGLLVVFDEDATRAQILFRVSEVDFWTAARLLGQQTGTFFRALDAHTFLVVNDTQQKRREYLPQVERTLLLPESEKPEQMNEMVRAIRDIGGLTHTQLDTGRRSLTVRGSEHDVALATALLRQLEQPRGEVMLEIDILEVDRNTAENLGIVPPSKAQVASLSTQQIQTAQQSTEGLIQVINELFGTPSSFATASTQQLSTLLATGTVALSALVPPLISFGGGKTVFLATLPGAVANFAQTLSAVRTARRILLRAQDGEPANFFVGDRYPINLTNLSTAFTSGGNVPAIGFSALNVGLSPRGIVSTSLSTTASQTISSISRANGTVTATLNSALSVPGGNGVGVVNVTGVTDTSFDGSFVVLTGSGTTTLTWSQTGANASSSGGSVASESHLDLVTANHDAGTVSVLLGNGDGTFQTHVDYPAGTNPVALAAAPFRGSGAAVDLAVVDQGTDSVLILLGNGDGTFQAPVSYPVGRVPSGIVLADFNADGHTDIAVTNTNDNTISVLMGKGDGTFQPATTLALAHGQGPVGLAAADFNGDSFTDLIVTNSITNTVTLLLGDGHGLFPTQEDIPTGTMPVAVAVADFNGDSQADFVVANQTAGTISVFLNQGMGVFNSRTDFTVGSQPDAVITGDFNNDGRQDILVANSGDNSVSVFFGGGNGTFPANASIPVGRSPAGLASGDFNGDGLADLAVTNADDSSVTVVINSQQLATANPQTLFPGSQYEDIGVKAKATPRIHPSGDVTLTLSLEIRNLLPTSFNGIPVISNRTVEQTIRLRPDEPSVLSGLFSDQQMLNVTGTPGAVEVPGLEQVLSNRNPTGQQNELIVVVTPRNVRLAPRVEQVLYAGHDRLAGTAGAQTQILESPEPEPTPPGIPPGEAPGGVRPLPNPRQPLLPPQPAQPEPQPQPQPQPPQPQR